jgi:hypothetical protein
MNNRAQNSLAIDAGILDQTVSQWMPSFVQPFRLIVRDRGTTLAQWLPDIVTVSHWIPTSVQPSRIVVRASGDSFTKFFYIPSPGPPVFVTRLAPDPWRGTSIRVGPDPSRGTAERRFPVATAGPPVIPFTIMAAPDNSGFALSAVADPARATSAKVGADPKRGTSKRAVSPVVPYVPPPIPPPPEVVTMDKWIPFVSQPDRRLVRDKGDSSVGPWTQLGFSGSEMDLMPVNVFVMNG